MRTIRNHAFRCSTSGRAGLATLALVGLLGALPASRLQADADQRGAGTRISQVTRELLRQHELRRLARNDPREAIRAVDRLRADGTIEAVVGALAIAEIALATDSRDLGLLLCAADVTFPFAVERAAEAADPDAPVSVSVALHRRALVDLVDSLPDAVRATPGHLLEIDGPLQHYQISRETGLDSLNFETHKLVTADSLERNKRQFTGQRAGLGAPVVAVSKVSGGAGSGQGDDVFPIYRDYYPLTVVYEPTPAEDGAPRPVRLRLIDPRVHDTVAIGDRDIPIALDIGAQIAAAAQEIDVTFARDGVRHAARYMSVTGLYLLEPLRADKIPVVLIHGLNSSPRTWSEAFDAFTLDPALRRNYQIWFFAYPTGLPFPYSAALLRRALFDAIDRLEQAGADAGGHRAVLIGHSMGGLLTRMQTADSDDVLWHKVFEEPPDELDLPAEDVAVLEEVLVLEPLPFVGRAIFCSVPHRGSRFAANALGKLGSSLVRAPAEMMRLSQRLVVAGFEALTPTASERGEIPTSVQALQPKAPILEGLDEIGVADGLTYHSIIGDRGKGNSPDSSDGVVPYWSSHLEGAASELIVPSGHASHRHPDGVEELRRILHSHLGEANDEGVDP